MVLDFGEKSPPCLKEGGPSQTVGGFNKTTESGNENLKKVKQFRQSVRNCFLYNENYAIVHLWVAILFIYHFNSSTKQSAISPIFPASSLGINTFNLSIFCSNLSSVPVRISVILVAFALKGILYSSLIVSPSS